MRILSSMTKSEIFLYFCLFFILGVFLSSFFNFGPISLILLSIFGIFMISVPPFSKKKGIVVFGFCFIFLVFGIFRHQLIEAQFERPELENLKEKKFTLVGQVIEEPDVRVNKVKLEVKVEELKSKILITTHLYPKIEYGDRLKIEGVLKEPPEFEGFNYRDYLKKEGIYFLMNYPKIEILERNYGNPIKSVLISFKNKLKDSLRKIISSPQSGLFEALLFGEEENISAEWKLKLNITGTRHIAAVSGMNITIICTLLLNLLLALGLWRQQAFYLSLILIFLYVLMIGAPSCGIRAALMGTLLLASQYFGRIAKPERLMVFALSLMLVFNPLLLKEDIGFQLSFLAVAGLIYLQPFFSKILRKIPENFQLRSSLSSTLAAQVFTLPVLLYNFGQISLVSPLTNVLILPSIPYLTIAGFLFSFLGIFWTILGQIVSWPAYFLLTFVMKIIDFFSKFSFASKSFKINWVFLLISYLILAIFVWQLREREKLRFLKY